MSGQNASYPVPGRPMSPGMMAASIPGFLISSQSGPPQSQHPPYIKQPPNQPVSFSLPMRLRDDVTALSGSSYASPFPLQKPEFLQLYSDPYYNTSHQQSTDKVPVAPMYPQLGPPGFVTRNQGQGPTAYKKQQPMITPTGIAPVQPNALPLSRPSSSYNHVGPSQTGFSFRFPLKGSDQRHSGRQRQSTPQPRQSKAKQQLLKMADEQIFLFMGNNLDIPRGLTPPPPADN